MRIYHVKLVRIGNFCKIFVELNCFQMYKETFVYPSMDVYKLLTVLGIIQFRELFAKDGQ